MRQAFRQFQYPTVPLHADMALKENAIARTSPPGTQATRRHHRPDRELPDRGVPGVCDRPRSRAVQFPAVTAGSLGQVIGQGYAYAGTDYPTRATLRSWHKQLGALMAAANRVANSGNVADVNTIEDHALKIDIGIIVAFTAITGSQPLPVSSVNWGQVTVWAEDLELACGDVWSRTR